MNGVIGHGGILRELRTLAGLTEPPHALLLAGPEHTGRALLACFYAMVLNCEQAQPGQGTMLAPGELPCRACRPCRLIEEGAHPDLITLAPGDTLCRPRDGEGSHARHPDSRDIRICQVRGVIELASRFPFEARFRVLIIDPAERLNREAANMLLKTLEEPPGHTIFVLLSAAPEGIPETVVSRCRRIDSGTVERGIIEAGLRERGFEAGVAEQAAQAARGRPGIALAFASQPGLMGDRERLLERCAEIAAANLRDRLKYAGQLAERWRIDRASASLELEAWEAFWEEHLQAAAESRDEALIIGATEALRALRRAREDLLAQVMTRLALEVMILSFPRFTLDDGTPGGRPEAVYA